MRRFPFVVAIAATLLAAPSAQAAFPGANGRIAFTRDATPTTSQEIWTAAPDGSDPRQITNNGWADRMPAFSPDGTKIAFVSLENGTANPEIYVMDADGNNRTRLTTQAANIHRGRPGLVPRRQEDRVHEQPLPRQPGHLGHGRRRHRPGAAHGQRLLDDSDLARSPDGSTIAFVTTRDFPVTEIWAMTEDRGTPSTR